MADKGYTLIEIIVVIAVGAVLSGIGLFSLNTLNRRQALVQNAKMLVSEIRLAKSLADAQQKPVGCGTLYGYKFFIETGSQTVIEAICNNAAYEHQSRITSAVLSGMQAVFFPVLQQPAEFTGSNQIIVTLNGQIIKINIGISGVVDYE